MPENKLVYFDESGDDGTKTGRGSSPLFILTGIYMPSGNWIENDRALHRMRRDMKDTFGLPVDLEFHTKPFLNNDPPYSMYPWTVSQRRDILLRFASALAKMELRCTNVIIDKSRIPASSDSGGFSILEAAVAGSIGLIDSDSGGTWNYIMISDKGRVGAMRKTARSIRDSTPTPSGSGRTVKNMMIEDILEKDSRESRFIQACDFISYFCNLYYLCHDLGQPLPSRVAYFRQGGRGGTRTRFLNAGFVASILDTLKDAGKLGPIPGGSAHPYGFLVLP